MEFKKATLNLYQIVSSELKPGYKQASIIELYIDDVRFPSRVSGIMDEDLKEFEIYGLYCKEFVDSLGIKDVEVVTGRRSPLYSGEIKEVSEEVRESFRKGILGRTTS